MQNKKNIYTKESREYEEKRIYEKYGGTFCKAAKNVFATTACFRTTTSSRNLSMDTIGVTIPNPYECRNEIYTCNESVERGNDWEDHRSIREDDTDGEYKFKSLHLDKEVYDNPEKYIDDTNKGEYERFTLFKRLCISTPVKPYNVPCSVLNRQGKNYMEDRKSSVLERMAEELNVHYTRDTTDEWNEVKGCKKQRHKRLKISHDLHNLPQVDNTFVSSSFNHIMQGRCFKREDYGFYKVLPSTLGDYAHTQRLRECILAAKAKLNNGLDYVYTADCIKDLIKLGKIDEPKISQDQWIADNTHKITRQQKIQIPTALIALEDKNVAIEERHEQARVYYKEIQNNPPFEYGGVLLHPYGSQPFFHPHVQGIRWKWEINEHSEDKLTSWELITVADYIKGKPAWAGHIEKLDSLLVNYHKKKSKALNACLEKRRFWRDTNEIDSIAFGNDRIDDGCDINTFDKGWTQHMTWFGFVRYYEPEMRKVAAKNTCKRKGGELATKGLPLFNPGIGIGSEILEEMAAKGRLDGVFNDKTFLPFELSSSEPLTPTVLSRRYRNMMNGVIRHYNICTSLGQYWGKIGCSRFKRIYGDYALQSIVTSEMGNLFVALKSLLHFTPPKNITVGALTQKGILTTCMNIGWVWKKDYEYIGCHEDDYWECWEKRRKVDLEKDALLAILDTNLKNLDKDIKKEREQRDNDNVDDYDLTEYVSQLEQHSNLLEEINKTEAALEKTEIEIPIPNIENYYYTNREDSSKGMPRLKDELSLVITSNDSAYNVLYNPPSLDLCHDINKKDSQGCYSVLSPTEAGIYIHEKLSHQLIEAMYAFHPWLHRDIYSFTTDSASTMNPFVPMSRTTPDAMVVRSPDHLMKLRGLFAKKVEEGLMTAENFGAPLDTFFTPEEMEIVQYGAPVYKHEFKTVQQKQDPKATVEQNYRAFIPHETVENFMNMAQDEKSLPKIRNEAVKILRKYLVLSKKMDEIAYGNPADLPTEHKINMLRQKSSKAEMKRRKKYIADYCKHLKGNGVTIAPNGFMPLVRRSAVEIAEEEASHSVNVNEDDRLDGTQPDNLNICKQLEGDSGARMYNSASSISYEPLYARMKRQHVLGKGVEIAPRGMISFFDKESGKVIYKVEFKKAPFVLIPGIFNDEIIIPGSHYDEVTRSQMWNSLYLNWKAKHALSLIFSYRITDNDYTKRQIAMVYTVESPYNYKFLEHYDLHMGKYLGTLDNRFKCEVAIPTAVAVGPKIEVDPIIWNEERDGPVPANLRKPLPIVGGMYDPNRIKPVDIRSSRQYMQERIRIEILEIENLRKDYIKNTGFPYTFRPIDKTRLDHMFHKEIDVMHNLCHGVGMVGETNDQNESSALISVKDQHIQEELKRKKNGAKRAATLKAMLHYITAENSKKYSDD